MKPNAKFSLLYSGKRDGWNRSDFHRMCDGKAPTMVLFKSTKEFCFGGFTSIPWAGGNSWKEDRESFVFSVDSRELVFKPKDYSRSVRHHSIIGPNFGDLGMFLDPMNGNNSGCCYINCITYKDIGCDSEGNHVLTGDGKGKSDHDKYFTCTALEVYLVQY